MAAQAITADPDMGMVDMAGAHPWPSTSASTIIEDSVIVDSVTIAGSATAISAAIAASATIVDVAAGDNHR